MKESNNTEKNNPITIIHECSVPSDIRLIERSGFIYLLNKIKKLEKMQDEENESQIEHSATVTPLWLRYTLSIEEAADYFGIGTKRLRELVYLNPNAEYVLEIGAHKRIKRKLFEEYIDQGNVI